MGKGCKSETGAEYYRDGMLNINSGEGDLLPALAPVAATHTGLKRTPVMNVQ